MAIFCDLKIHVLNLLLMFGKCTLPRWSVQSELPSFIIIFCHSLSVFSIKIKHFPYFFFVIEWVPDNLILFTFPWDGDLTIFYRHLLDGCPWQLYEFIAILVIECHTIVPVMITRIIFIP